MPSPFTDIQLYEEYNRLSSFELCMHAQEIIQDSVTKLIDFINLLKATTSTSLLGDQNSYLQRKQRIEDTINSFEIVFQRLRILGQIVHQNKFELDQKPVDTQLLNTNLDCLKVEQGNIKEQLKEKNAYIKVAIDKVSEIIWQINSMQKFRQ